MRSDDITKALDVGQKWTRQVKAEEKRPSARVYRAEMWTASRSSLKEICNEFMEQAWNQASDNGRLPTHWRQVFYVIRPLCEEHSDRPLLDATFKNILEEYLAENRPGWDVLRGARGVFKEPHSAKDDTGLAMSTMNVRGYLAAGRPSQGVEPIAARFPTKGAKNRIAAVLISEKEGFDELLIAEDIPARFDLALMSTKGISARAARDLAKSLGVPCFTLHDLDKNGFVMAGGFPFATDIGIRMADVEHWNLAPEDQRHENPDKAYANLIRNGATPEEAEFVSGGRRVELNMLTSREFVEFVEGKLEEHGVEKVMPDEATLAAAWERARLAKQVNDLIEQIQTDKADVTPMPDGLADRLREALEEDPEQSWDEALWDLSAADDEEES